MAAPIGSATTVAAATAVVGIATVMTAAAIVRVTPMMRAATVMAGAPVMSAAAVSATVTVATAVTRMATTVAAVMSGSLSIRLEGEERRRSHRRETRGSGKHMIEGFHDCKVGWVCFPHRRPLAKATHRAYL